MNSHILYTDKDYDVPDSIKDNNGDIVLHLCRRCGRGESDLYQPCVPEVKARKDSTVFANFYHHYLNTLSNARYERLCDIRASRKEHSKHATFRLNENVSVRISSWSAHRELWKGR